MRRSRCISAFVFVVLALVPALPLWATRVKQNPRESAARAPGNLELLARAFPGIPQENWVSPDLRDPAWSGYLSQTDGPLRIVLDGADNTPVLVEGSGGPWIPDSMNTLTWDEVEKNIQCLDLPQNYLDRGRKTTEAALEVLARGFIAAHPDLIPAGNRDLALSPTSIVQLTPELWNILFQRVHHGVPVEEGVLILRVKYGSLVQWGGHHLGAIHASALPAFNADTALENLFAYAGGKNLATDKVVEPPTLKFIPVESASLPASLRDPGNKSGYAYRLVWEASFRREGEMGTWTGTIDARTGEVLAFFDNNRYAQVTGGVFPVTNTDPESIWPMPWTNLSGGATGYTNGNGVYTYTAGTVTTTLNGTYVQVSDGCGAISESSGAPGNIALATSGGTDCTIPAGHSVGDTHSARSSFYHLNRTKEKARAYLPTNTWLQAKLLDNVNGAPVCNAYWNGVSVNFFRASAPCANTGEIAGVFIHEWGHGLDQNDGNPPLALNVDAAVGEAYGDTAAVLATHESCVGRGFLGALLCGYGNACTNCTGVRETNYAMYVTPTPSTPGNLASLNACPTSSSYRGRCAYEGHCESLPISQVIWDLANRDLILYPMPVDSAWQLTDKMFFASRPTAGSAYACTLNPATAGCAVDTWYSTFRVVDDADANPANGTPHAAQIFASFNRHQIGCGLAGDLANTNQASCPAFTPAAPVLAGTPGNNQVVLTWGAVTNAATYDVYKNESTCAAGFIKIGNTAALTFTDTAVVNGTPYNYRVQAIGTNTACFSNMSNCVTVTPTACSLPAVPTGLTATPGCTSIVLNWTASAGATTYTVLRGATCAGVASLATGIAGLTYTDATAVAGTSYYYAVLAVNACGSSANSACAGPTQLNLPGAPTGVAATTNSCANVVVSWTNGTGATSHNLLRYNGACPSVAGLVTFTGVATPYTDATAAAGSSYCYVVQAVNACGTTNAAGATGTRLATPAVPGAPTAVGTCAGVNLTWTAVPLATTYNILRGTTCAGVASLATGVAGTAYSDNTAVVGTTYYYALQAVNACGASATGACSAGAARLVSPAPTVTGPTSGCGSVLLSTQAYTAYQWYLGAAPIAGATAQTYTAVATGTYAVVVTAANGCLGTSPGYAVTVTPGSQTYHFQVQATFVAGYKDMQNATGFEAAVQQQATANITAPGQYQIGATPLKWISPAYAKNTDLASSPWTFDVYGLTTYTGAAGQLYAKVYRYNGGVPVLLFTTGYANPNISTATSQTRFTWTYTPAAGTTVLTGDRLYTEIWVNATAGSAGGSAATTASAYTPTWGTQTLTFAATQVCDTTRHVITEEADGSNNETVIDGYYTFAAINGTPTFQFVGSYSGGATLPVQLSYSINNPAGPWTNMFTVTNAAENACAAPQTFVLPSVATLPVYVRAYHLDAAGNTRFLSTNYMAMVVGTAAPYFTLNYDFASADSLVTAADCAAAAVPPGEISPGSTSANAQTWAADKLTLGWQSDPVATGYRLYKGTPANLTNLTTATADSCTRYDGAALTYLLNTGTDLPASGSFFWFLVTAYNGGGEGPAGNITGVAGGCATPPCPRLVNTTGVCP